MTRSIRIGAFGAVLALLVLAAPATGAAADFLPGTEDVPLAPGLSLVEDRSLAFDSPAGRVVVVEASGAIDAAALRRFYAESLPALGWRRAGDSGYVRAGERLKIETRPADGRLAVRFTIAPE